jgi:hypothetical protein
MENLSEAKKLNISRVEFENIGGLIGWDFNFSELMMQFISSNAVKYKAGEKYLKAYQGSDKDWEKWITTDGKAIMEEIYKAADKFDKEVLSILNKYGFKK